MPKMTLEEAIKDLETPLQEVENNTIELSIIGNVKTKMKHEYLKSMLDEPRIKKLVLELPDGSEIEVELLHADTLSVNRFSDL